MTSEFQFHLAHIQEGLPTPGTLETGDVHIWIISVSSMAARVTQFRRWLNDNEIERLHRMTASKKRMFLLCRGLLRGLLGEYLECTPNEVPIMINRYGKPALANPFDKLQFNLTHSADVALFAFTLARPIGVDIEAIRPIHDLSSIVQNSFTIQQQRQWNSVAVSSRLFEFFRIWTLNEAVGKALGRGPIAVQEEDWEQMELLEINTILGYAGFVAIDSYK